MAYQAKSYEHLLGTPGFSDALLKNHFTLYQGYVTNTNKVLDLTNALAAEGKAATPEFAELKRRLGWEWNGMRLHEYYFGNMVKGGKALDPGSALAQKLAAEFGSVEAWEKHFRGVGAMRGIGWTALYQDPATGGLMNMWVGEHDGGHPAGGTLLLIMDVFEHAFMLDYGLKRPDYIAAFFAAIDWSVVSARFDAAPKKV